jgi:hypothetical protein
MVFNATFNNISVISWWSVLLVEETGGPGENHRPVNNVESGIKHHQANKKQKYYYYYYYYQHDK